MACCSNPSGTRRVPAVLPLLLAALSTFALAACNGDSDRASSSSDFEIQFDVRAGEQPVRCGAQLPALGVNGRMTRLEYLRFYVHDLQLIDHAGNRVALALSDDGYFQGQNVA